jgi:hypothetical protein
MYVIMLTKKERENIYLLLQYITHNNMTVYVHIQYMMLYVCVTLTVNKQYNM